MLMDLRFKIICPSPLFALLDCQPSLHTTAKTLFALVCYFYLGICTSFLRLEPVEHVALRAHQRVRLLGR